MSLTKMETRILRLLKAYEADEDEMTWVLLLLRKEEEMLELIEWMKTHTDATVNEVMDQALLIYRRNKTKVD